MASFVIFFSLSPFVSLMFECVQWYGHDAMTGALISFDSFFGRAVKIGKGQSMTIDMHTEFVSLVCFSYNENWPM